MSVSQQTRVSDRLRICATALVIGLVVSSLSNTRRASAGVFQDGSRTTITADDFTNRRSENSSAGNTMTPQGGRIRESTPLPPKPKPKRTYKSVTKAKTPAPKQTSTVLAQLGITIWRLRPSLRTDTGARMLVREDERTRELVPERVDADTIFREGDQIRLSIESPQVGYLYVIDRELLTEGTTGSAMLIYPWSDMRGGDNKMSPGRLVDIPAQEDSPSFFTARRSSARHVGELLTVIVSKNPLNLPVSDKPLEISVSDLMKWEKSWAGDTERFELDGGVGETWTEPEKQAGSQRGSRQLTREDPAPQTLYRLHTANNQAILVNVKLRYAK